MLFRSHIQQDVLKILKPCDNGYGYKDYINFTTVDDTYHILDKKWDMIIAFPPCTHLAVSGAAHFEKKRADGRQREGIEFFMKFINADCDKIAIENPIGIISGNYIAKHFSDLQEKYNFPIIKSNNFGHCETKTVIPIGTKAKIDTNEKEKIKLLEKCVK